MGLFDRIKQLFRTKIELSSSESNQHSSDSIQMASKVPEQSIAISTTPTSLTSYESTITPSMDKSSYELGLAAGYTGRSIKEIESSLGRIESQMVTKDWAELRMHEQLEKYDQILQQRIQRIEQSLGIMQTTISTGITVQQQANRPSLIRLPLTPRMEQILLAMKELKQSSYDELAIRLDMGIDELRSLLSIMTKRTSLIDRFRINRRGWLRYKDDESSE